MISLSSAYVFNLDYRVYQQWKHKQQLGNDNSSDNIFLEKGQYLWTTDYPFPKWQILDSSKLKEFADDNFTFHKNGRSQKG